MYIFLWYFVLSSRWHNTSSLSFLFYKASLLNCKRKKKERCRNWRRGTDWLTRNTVIWNHYVHSFFSVPLFQVCRYAPYHQEMHAVFSWFNYMMKLCRHVSRVNTILKAPTVTKQCCLRNRNIFLVKFSFYYLHVIYNTAVSTGTNTFSK